jgi:hypothetical protein
MSVFARLICLLALSGAPCAAFAQTAEMPTPEAYAVGESWEWRRVDALTKLEEARIVATGAKSDAGPVFSMDGKTVPIAERLTQGPYNPSAKPWRVWPLVVGKRWEFEADWARPDGVTGSTQQKVEVTAYEEVTVPAGKFMAYKIVHRGFFRNSRGNSGQQDDTFWHAPDVKSDVKFERKSGRPVFVTELTSHKRPAP